MRRLNRVEYENTLRDLLGVEVSVHDLLPPDTSAAGFDNVGEALHLSSFQMERYLEAADRALDLAIANGPRPALISKAYHPGDERGVRVSTERVFLRQDDGLVLFSSSPWNAVTLGQFYPPDRGRYRFRIKATAIQSGGKPVSVRIEAGPMLMGTTNHLVGYFDAQPDRSTLIEFTDFLEARSTIRLLPHALANAQTVDRIGADQYTGPGLKLDAIQVEGPLHEVWPPESHTRIFAGLQSQPIGPGSPRLEVVSTNPIPDTQAILSRFAARAFRRPVREEEVHPLVQLVEKCLADGYSFEQAVRVGLKAILVHPEFLFLREPAGAGRLDPYALASRLSYFLWSTMPDAELLSAAGDGRLDRPDGLRLQVERMLRDPRASAFTTHFTGQWLGLRDLDFTEPDRRLYPEYDGLLRDAMEREPRLFFEELLRQDLGVPNFVGADFTFLNERLARHYGIPGVEGHAFRKVSLPPTSHRGGVMTMAAVLKVTANGTSTSPVIRGAWVLDRLLGQPPAPPPAGVPAVEPDIRGATTIREQMARHRENPACAGCHTRIDPPGFALESFDVIGGWRDHYRSVGRGEPVLENGRRLSYLRGPQVDAGDVLPDGRRFRDVDELKKLLLADSHQITRAFATRLVTYATGRAPRAGDRAALEAVLSRAKGKNYGLRTLVHEVVQSPLFRER